MMAYGNELMLVLDQTVLKKYLDPAQDEDWDSEDSGPLSEFVDLEVCNKLAQVHLELVREHLDSSAEFNPDGRGIVFTPPKSSGRRTLSTFSVDFASDEDYENATYGISLVSRYYPVWVDWQHAHGGSDSPIVLDTETLRMVELARNAIVEVIPEVAHAPLAVVLNHY